MKWLLIAFIVLADDAGGGRYGVSLGREFDSRLGSHPIFGPDRQRSVTCVTPRLLQRLRMNSTIARAASTSLSEACRRGRILSEIVGGTPTPSQGVPAESK